MKIDFMDNNLIVFLNSKKISQVDFLNKCEVERYIRDILFSIEKTYNISLCGSYNINVYLDRFYGAILEIIEDSQCFDCYNIVDIDISISEIDGFIYKLDDVIDIDGVYYLYNGEVYFDPKGIDFISLGLLLENSQITYGKRCLMVKSCGKKISNPFIIDKMV